MRSRNKLKVIVLLALLLFPNFYALFAASDLSSPAKAGVYILVACMGLALPMLFLRRRTYFIVMGVLCLFCAPIEIASLYLNHNPATGTFIGLFYATNLQEIMGVVGAIWPLLVLLVAIWIVYFIIATHMPDDWIISRKVGLWFAGIGLPLLFGGGMFFFSRYARNIYRMQDTKEVLAFAKDLTLMKFYKIFPYNIYLNTYHIFADYRAMNQTQKVLGSFCFGLEAQKDSLPELYILVIGEAARSGNFALNGYCRPTTPCLSKRKNIVCFPNIYSQAGTTEQSVPHMISRIPITYHDRINEEKTLPEAFQEAGFEVAWLTNQSRILHLRRVLEVVDKRYETGKDMSTNNNYDELLLQPLREILANGKNKQFIVLHTMGSHWRYDRRYTSDFEQFTPTLGNDFRLSMISPSNKQLLLNAYDNTILYTDYFLDSLISILAGQHVPTLMLYMSDHGENLYDDERLLVLHGNYSTSKWLFHVPLIVWYSDEYAALHPEKTNQLCKHIEYKDNSSLIFPSMLDAAGIEYINDTANSAIMRTRSIFSQGYTPLATLYVMTAEEECIVLNEEVGI